MKLTFLTSLAFYTFFGAQAFAQGSWQKFIQPADAFPEAVEVAEQLVDRELKTTSRTLSLTMTRAKHSQNFGDYLVKMTVKTNSSAAKTCRVNLRIARVTLAMQPASVIILQVDYRAPVASQVIGTGKAICK